MLSYPFNIIDLTHTIDSNCPTWEGSCGFSLDNITDYDEMFRTQKLKILTSIGTHMDAPSHLFDKKKNIDELHLKNLIMPLHIIDVSDRSNADYDITVSDVLQYEKIYGDIKPKSLVIGFTGWSSNWGNPKKYRNEDELGNIHFPAFSIECGSYLFKKDIYALGIDTLSPDCRDKEFSIHNLFLGGGRVLIENVANCSNVPKSGAYAIAFPLKISQATESPIRLAAIFN